MPTLPLFTPSPTPGDPHQIQSPGGYETWRFVAHDSAAQTWITAAFYQGYPSHNYLRRYFRFRRFPTRFIPPVPTESCVLEICILVKNQFRSSTTRFNPAQFPAEIFSNRPDGAIQLHTQGLDLLFRSRFRREPQELNTESRAVSPTHRWLLPTSHCDVTGSFDSAQSPFTGTGFRDQFFGTAPMLQPTLDVFLFHNETMCIVHASHALIADERRAMVHSINRIACRRTPWGLSYPAQITPTENLILSTPRIVHSTAIRAYCVYQAMCSTANAVALCDIRAPARRAWPILGRFHPQ